VLAVYNHEAQSGAKIGMIVQFGGQTPLNLASACVQPECPSSAPRPNPSILPKTASVSASCLKSSKFPSPRRHSHQRGRGSRVGERIGYPVLVRPSYVLGGRAMVICYDGDAVAQYMTQAVEYSQERPVLVDHFLESASKSTSTPSAIPRT